MAAGVRPEERLLLCMADSPELLALFLGGLYIGAVPVPVSTMADGRGPGRAGDRQPGPLLIAISSEFIGAAQDAAGRRCARWSSPGRPRTSSRCWCRPGGPGPRIRTLRGFLAAAGAADLAVAGTALPTLADCPALWLYTSGTTGTPKAAMHRHGALRVTAETYAAARARASGRTTCASPPRKFFFAYGLGNAMTFPFSVGARAILDRARATPAGSASVLASQRPTLFFAAPTFYAALLAADLPPTSSPACGWPSAPGVVPRRPV